MIQSKKSCGREDSKGHEGLHKSSTTSRRRVEVGWRDVGNPSSLVRYLIIVYSKELSRKVQIMSILSDQTCPGGATRRLVTSDDQHQIELTRTA